MNLNLKLAFDKYQFKRSLMESNCRNFYFVMLRDSYTKNMDLFQILQNMIDIFLNTFQSKKYDLKILFFKVRSFYLLVFL